MANGEGSAVLRLSGEMMLNSSGGTSVCHSCAVRGKRIRHALFRILPRQQPPAVR